jgi:hypothetical protein
MSDAMTIEEAVRIAEWSKGLTVHGDRAQFIPDAMSHQKASDVLERIMPAFHVLAAHAERTVEARGGEPEFVAAMREAIGNCQSLFANEAVLMSHIDHLTARAEKAEADNTFARAEWAHWEAEACRIEKERKALEARLAEVEWEVQRLRAENVAQMNQMANARRIAQDFRGDSNLLRAILQADIEDGGSGLLKRVHDRARAAEADRDALAAIVDPCAKFVAQALDDHTTARWWADADMQDHLKAHGFLAEERVTEDTIAECGGACECEVGYNCYRFTPLAHAVRDRALTPTREEG